MGFYFMVLQGSLSSSSVLFTFLTRFTNQLYQECSESKCVLLTMNVSVKFDKRVLRIMTVYYLILIAMLTD
jgi:hypothetical protein